MKYKAFATKKAVVTKSFSKSILLSSGIVMMQLLTISVHNPDRRIATLLWPVAERRPVCDHVSITPTDQWAQQRRFPLARRKFGCAIKTT